jgi:magnesium chelatase family protein
MYQKRLSGPLLDRIDLIVNVSRVPNDTLLNHASVNKKQHIEAKNSINNAVKRQFNRYKSSIKNNSNLSSSEIKSHLALSPEVRQLLGTATERLNLSARSYFKVIKVARTIADIENSDTIEIPHVTEALQYRQTS